MSDHDRLDNIEERMPVNVAAWLSTRQPPVPPALGERLTQVIDPQVTSVSRDLPAMLVERAKQLISGLPEGRSAALDLLTADALITYAMEAAADDAALLEEAATHSLGRISAASAER